MADERVSAAALRQRASRPILDALGTVTAARYQGVAA